MNQEIKEQFVKKVLESHLMWSGTNDRNPSDNTGVIQSEFINARREQWFDSFEEFMSMTEEEHDAWVAIIANEFDEITKEADNRWEKALEVMGL